MVGRLDEALREDIESMLLAIVTQDAQQLTSLVMRLGAVPPGLDEAALSVDLSEFVAHYANQPADAFDLAGALTEMIEIIQRYHIVLPSSLAMLIKVLVMLDGTGRLLAPHFSLMELVQPYQRKLLQRRLSPARQMRKMRRIFSELEQLAEILPRRLRDILQQVDAGKFDVHLDHRGLEPSVNRLVLGMMTSALFLGSSLMLAQHVWPIRDVSVPGVLGMALSHVPRLATPQSHQQIRPAGTAEVIFECVPASPLGEAASYRAVRVFAVNRYFTSSRKARGTGFRSHDTIAKPKQLPLSRCLNCINSKGTNHASLLPLHCGHPRTP